MIAAHRFLSQNLARWTSLDVIRLGPLFGQSLLLGWVALDPPFLTGHAPVRLFVTRGTDIGNSLCFVKYRWMMGIEIGVLQVASSPIHTRGNLLEEAAEVK